MGASIKGAAENVRARKAKRAGIPLSAGMILVTLGVVYGDIGTSPMYTLKAIMSGNGGLATMSTDVVLGALSLIIWTLTLITTVKYVLVAMKADNHNEGGIFALYSLVKRCGKWLIIPAMVGGAALLADGILTPAVTVTTAIEGLRTVDFCYAFIGDNQNIVVAITIAILCVLFAMQQAGTSTIGKFFGPVMTLWFLFLGISGLFKAAVDIRGNSPFLERLFEFLDIPNGMYQGSLTTEKRSDRKYDIEFRDVSFRYPGRADYALRHVSMRFRVGSRLAVVGPNGSGKTTFIKLLCRLYDPTEGQILLNGIDIRKYRYREYMDLFAVVFQDFKLLALPLGENVAARRDYDRERAADCLRKAGFGERLASMPQGLDTYLYKDLDKEGVEVSGGEAQKIAIARALYQDAPFIILDEPTAALDPVAEAEIYSKFNDIAGDKTAIYISHRLSSCKFCDEIAVFDGGAVVQQGRHEDLLAEENGLYHALWEAQAQYYTSEKG